MTTTSHLKLYEMVTLEFQLYEMVTLECGNNLLPRGS